MQVAASFIRRDFLIATSYKTAFAVQILRIVIAVPLLFYMSELVGGNALNYLERYGGNYFAFIVVGIGFLDYLAISLKSFNQSLRDGQLTGTLEIMLLSPNSLSKLLICSSLWVYLFATIRFGLYMGIGLLFGLDLGNCDIVSALTVLFMAVVSLLAFGIISACVTMVIKRGEFLNGLMATATIICSGVLYPVDAMAPWMQSIAALLPATYALEGIRLAVYEGYSLAQLWSQIAILGIFVAILLPLSLVLFRLAVDWTKRTGTLAQY